MRPELRLPAVAQAGAGAHAVVLDTNIVLDLFLFADPAVAAVRTLLRARRLHWLTTQPMRDELGCVLQYAHLRPRMQHHGVDAADVLAAFDAGTRLVDVAARAPYVCKDADDQKFIDLAVAHRAILVSKDKAVLCMRKRLLTLDTHVTAAIVFDDATPCVG
ncbi:putative toxin-antitoxin system toxin component, PIN family [Alicycliphilus denitrificans]|uniref:putative toxin-antitoxin system toxin component, PIN family n=1 Tax=Alicycliphilus denitrificans TaxID=179636 RepID=UPI00384AAC46